MLSVTSKRQAEFDGFRWYGTITVQYLSKDFSRVNLFCVWCDVAEVLGKCGVSSIYLVFTEYLHVRT
jgi:hypothetical protein